ncbi:MAG: hypothetical protein PHO08_17815 [Methylococcales bacterium]|nr:hypothetical protein [Methylococcales bacterium]
MTKQFASKPHGVCGPGGTIEDHAGRGLQPRSKRLMLLLPLCHERKRGVRKHARTCFLIQLLACPGIVKT